MLPDPPSSSATDSVCPVPLALFPPRYRPYVLASVFCIIWLVVLGIIGVRLFALHHKHARLAAIAAVATSPATQPTTTVYELLANTGHKWATSQNVYENAGTYRYSPLIAALLVPLALLPNTVGGTLWLLLNALLFFGGIIYWLRVAAPPGWSAHHRILVLLLATPLLVGNFNNTQANPMLLGFMLAAVAACLESRFTLAALCITAATLLKVYPLALGLVLVVLYPRQLSWRITLFLLIGAALPFALQKPHYVADSYTQWLAALGNDERGGSLRTSYRDFALLWHFYLGDEMNRTVYITLQLSAAALIGLTAFVTRFLRPWTNLPRERVLLLLALVSAWIMLLGPSTESATYMLLAPPAAFFLYLCRTTYRAALLTRADPFVARFAFYASSGLFALTYLLLLSAVIVQITPFGRDYATHGPQPFAALLFVAGLIAWAIQTTTNPPRPGRAGNPTPM